MKKVERIWWMMFLLSLTTYAVGVIKDDVLLSVFGVVCVLISAYFADKMGDVE